MNSNDSRTAPHETKIQVNKLDFFYKDFRALHEIRAPVRTHPAPARV
jgi:hypothetical protein